MHYFVGIGIPTTVTGVDKAMFNRLKLFKNNHIDAKIITTLYNHLEYGWCVEHGIENDVLNMYDYFQHATSFKPTQHFNYYEYWCQLDELNALVLSNDRDVQVMRNNKMVMYARFTDSNLRQLDFLNHFNDKGQFVKHEEFDSRGFLSSVSHYNNNKVVYQEFLTPTGEKVLEKYYDDKNVNTVSTSIYLKNDLGFFDRFQDETALVTHFIQQIYNAGDQFIIDRPLEIVPAFIRLNKQYPVAVVVHMMHISEINPNLERLKWPFEELFNHLECFDALICSTENQKNDVLYYINKYHPDQKIKVFNIPVGFINQLHSLQIAKKEPFKLISIARYEKGKNLDHQIRLAHQLKPHFNQLTLDLYGFGEEYYALQQQINQLQANDYVTLKGYANDLSNVYASATLSLITSHSEGFSLAILESLNYNTPVISYDVKYGPNEMIENNVNGHLIPYGDEQTLFDKAFAVLNDAALKNQYYQQCENIIQKYHASHVFNKWQNLLHFLQYDL